MAKTTEYALQIAIGGKIASSLKKAVGGSTKELSKMQKVALVAAKVTAGAITSIAGGAVKLSKEVVDKYSDFEQLKGGVETLFGAGGKSIEEYAKSVGKPVSAIKDEYNTLMAAQDTVMKNSQNAFMTTGLSANEYMETVTSFSASLISSMGGDTVVAASKADQALVQMSDNASKMGSDISSIQNAYQGFAKQNYGMLDNLKLGYGGSKKEMERLLSDANKINKKMGKNTNYVIDSYADVIDAIKVVQDEMGITGTTAKEATQTISGSIGMTKAAWDNFITGLGNPDADMDLLADNLVNSATNVVSNIMPIIQNIAAALPGALQGVIEAIVATLNEGLLQNIISTVGSIANSIAGKIPDLVSTVISVLPSLLDAGVQIIITLINGITQSLPTLMPTITNCLLLVVDTIIANLPLILDAGVQILLALLDGVIQCVPQLVDYIPSIISQVIEIIDAAINDFFAAGGELIKGLWNGISDKVSWLTDKIKGFGSDVLDSIKSIFGIHSPSKETYWMGEMMSEGLTNGLSKSSIKAVKAAQKMSNQVLTVTSGIFDCNQNYTANVSGKIGLNKFTSSESGLNKFTSSESGFVIPNTRTFEKTEPITFVFSPVINYTGESKEEISSIFDEEFERFKAMMKLYERDKRRVTFA